ncbi:conserved oxidoreductase [Saccharomycodes ludwigii]|uniref:conserved oxidoreductase n=1 Tax=Saccharomycodes ludwigii TaxID=36035 RepID=UPI001E8473C6|nr:conserved oxidoreductase [Saccharomycodes ludwigii]KAH3901033.1 conserved oxidoreductase [Saccharomycodes ludwigii]
MSNPLAVVDISKPEQEITQHLLDAARNQGFLYIDGHGIPKTQVEKLFKISEDFFTNTPEEEKLKYSINPKTNIGYSHFKSENLDLQKIKDFKEAYNFGYIDFESGNFNQSKSQYYKDKNIFEEITNPTPQLFQNPSNSNILSDTMVRLHRVARVIMRLIAASLNIENKNFFTEKLRPKEPNGSTLRLLHYPLIRTDLDGADSLDEETLSIRAGAHTDYGALAMLFQKQGQQGLQLQLNGNNPAEWTNVPYIETSHEGMAAPLVINFGDLLNFWTQGILKSTVHRVKFKAGENRNSDRYSIVFFVHPEFDTLLEPVPSDIVKKASNGKSIPQMTALEHLQKRLKETYNW